MTKQVDLTLYVSHEDLAQSIKNHLEGQYLGSNITVQGVEVPFAYGTTELEVTFTVEGKIKKKEAKQLLDLLGPFQEPVWFGFEEV